MPTPSQQTNLASAIDNIRAAENLLKQQMNAASDSLSAIKLTNEFNNLDSFLSELLHAKNSADDASFANATTALQSHVTGLQADEATIKGIVDDVKIAADIISYITQALAFIAKL
jgi:negative regulator of replication initiation